MVKDKHSGENRGVAYIKFSKMSEACLAVQEQDGKPIGKDEKPLKVIIAQPKSSKSTEDQEEAALTRLFVSIPRGMTEQELRDVFTEFGDVDFINVVKDRGSGEPKGYGYVKYHTPYDTAKALEDSDRKFRTVMAQPKNKRRDTDASPGDRNPYGGGGGGNLSLNLGSNHRDYRGGASNHMGPSPSHSTPEMFMNTNHSAIDYRVDPKASFDNLYGGQSSAGSGAGGVSNRLIVSVSPVVNQENLGRLFDLIPGMEFCNLKKNYTTGESKGYALVVFKTVGSAIYAKEKLNGFEYPLGNKVTIQYAPEDGSDISPMMVAPPQMPQMAADGSDLAKAMGVSFNLPVQPLADSEADCVERVFLVCVPQALPDSQLKDIFCRFGNLIDAYMLKGKNFGYAKFASSDSARRAIELLNGVEVWGVKLKVIEAEPPKNQDLMASRASKRPRT